MQTTLLKQIALWQNAIVTQLIRQYPEHSATLLPRVRQLGLAVLWLVLCEQRGIFVNQSFESLQSGDRSKLQFFYVQLLEWLQQLHDQLGQPWPLILPESLPDCDDLLQKFVYALRHSVPPVALSSHLLGQVYEQSLGWAILQQPQGQMGLVASVVNKKSGGIYYTPQPIVHYVIEQTIDVSLQHSHRDVSTEYLYQADTLRIVDPACGGGAFLVAAYQRLLDWHLRSYKTSENHFAKLERGADGQWKLTFAERSRILQEHIYGVDLDPQAVAVTQLSLWLKLLEDLPEPLQSPLPDLSRNICCGDAVMQQDGFDWKKAFANVMQTGGFDVVIGNPPYLDSEWMAVHLPHCRHYCSKHYRSATGNWDLFCIFIEKSIALCRSGGLISLVVPNKLASADYARSVRQMLSQENQLLTVRDYSQVAVFAASVYPMVFVAQKTGVQSINQSKDQSKNQPSKNYDSPVRYERMQDLYQVQQTRSLRLHSSDPGQGWRLSSNHQQSCLLARLQHDFPKLGDVAQVRGAATVAEAYRIQPLIQTNSTPAPEDLQIVNSGTIDRYRFLWGERPLRYLGQSYLHPVIRAKQCAELPTQRYQQAKRTKLIVAGMTQRLECAIDSVGAILAGKSTSIIWMVEGAIDLRYLLGLLNSQLLSFYFSHSFGGNRLQGGYLRVGPPQLRALPVVIPKLDCAIDRKNYQQIIDWVEQRPYQPQLDQEIDRLVYRLYRLTDAEIDDLSEPTSLS